MLYMRKLLSCTALLASMLSCADESGSDEAGDGPPECVGGEFCPNGLVCVEGYCLQTSNEEETGPGDGDGDPSTGDGDGDPGDGDPGDGDPGDGDPGDGDPGDGDGDPTSGGECGDRQVDPGEECDDGNGSNYDSCLDCKDAYCGDGWKYFGVEDCDGDNIGGETCAGLGFSGGTLMCARDCSYDTSACMFRECGNGIIDDGEQCDGNNLSGWSCQDLGYGGGTLACDPVTCTYDTSSCTF